MTGASTDLAFSRGLWLTPEAIAWPSCALPEDVDPGSLDWVLHTATDGRIDLSRREPYPWANVPLTVRPAGLPEAIVAGRPYLRSAIGLDVPEVSDLLGVLAGQVVVTAQHRSGRLVEASGVQMAPLLDALYPDAVHATLGADWADGAPTVRVWAPTARAVDLLLWPVGLSLEDSPERRRMHRAPDGTWDVRGDRSWRGARYQYAVTVYAPTFDRVVENRVTDPYSVALTVNSTHSVLVDLGDADLRPQQWERTPSPPLAHPVDQVAYELHVRDFSKADKTVPDELRGTFAAFACDSQGTRHLRALAEAGLTSVQLLPISDYSSVDEERAARLRDDLAALKAAPPDSDEQQRRLAAARDGYNWGYDPWHYQVPEGSLCVRAADSARERVREVRAMVGALHGLGLRVVLDVVFNHTVSEGQATTSVLGRIVPGYYHRRDVSGAVALSTCCPNVATEHAMAQKLMVDSVVHWARHYRVDGFRFDLMGHHSRDNMLAVRAGLDALTVARDGVDGRAITLWGEGWDFGEVAGNARFVQATQGQLAGTQISTFADRLRDAVRGGAPFDEDPRVQGFVTGLAGEPNEAPVNGDADAQREQLLRDTDLIQVGLAGHLKDFSFTSAFTRRGARGDEVPYKAGTFAGYATEPDEAIAYVDAHDNETLFDALTLKLPVRVPMDERVRANTLALALATFSQNPVMWHAGTDFLRSKSLDRNSYDSGDWFNYLDFSLTDNGFAAGLPPAADNADKWEYMRPLLADPALKPRPRHMKRAHRMALDLLRIRSSTRLFRLGDAEQIRRKLSFPVSGSWAQQPGVIVMVIDDALGEPVDDRFGAVAVAVNANPWPVRQVVFALVGPAWSLHPVQRDGADAVVKAARADDGVLAVPGRTAAVFVRPRIS
ncbi:MAG: pullulanase-type alpha-1,6-glucosidase [Propioniciclava sp.]|uniref:pullulanase-type alpha-1,6-glucosidase n=1 Tax=Propioniciclava sp. TaxID=2038686 RepID=UPI0039E39BB3